MDRCTSLLIELCQFSSNIYEIKSERYLSEARMLNRISGIVNNPDIRNDFGVRGSRLLCSPSQSDFHAKWMIGSL